MFKAWLLYTRKQNNLRRLESAFTKRRNRHILEKYWYLVKTRYDYCVELAEIAESIVHEKNMKLMAQALQHWHFRLTVGQMFYFGISLLSEVIRNGNNMKF